MPEGENGEMPKMPTTEKREALAAYAHKAWSGWMRWMFDRCSPQDDGSTIVPAGLVSRWVRQMNTSYADLPDNEKESDRQEADEMLAIMSKE